jgi:hypothetical protein
MTKIFVQTPYDELAEKRYKKRIRLIIISIIILTWIFGGLLLYVEEFRVIWSIIAILLSLSFFIILFSSWMFNVSRSILPKIGKYEISNREIILRNSVFGDYIIPIKMIKSINSIDHNYYHRIYNSRENTLLKYPGGYYLNPFRLKTLDPIEPVINSSKRKRIVSFTEFIIGDDNEQTGYNTIRKRMNERNI